jgi:general stress protein 26
MEILDSSGYRRALHILEQASEITLASIRSDGSPHASTVSFANDGMELYVTIAIDSHKAHEIHRDPRIALTVNAPYGDWGDIQGMSIDGLATMIVDPLELERASALLLKKFPQFKDVIDNPSLLPWAGMLFVRISPGVVSLLDYTKGFGHTEAFRMN